MLTSELRGRKTSVNSVITLFSLKLHATPLSLHTLTKKGSGGELGHCRLILSQ